MTLSELQRARDVLNLSELSRAVGRERQYLRQYLNAGRELPADVQAALDRTLTAHGLSVSASRPDTVETS